MLKTVEQPFSCIPITSCSLKPPAIAARTGLGSIALAEVGVILRSWALGIPLLSVLHIWLHHIYYSLHLARARLSMCKEHHSIALCRSQPSALSSYLVLGPQVENASLLSIGNKMEHLWNREFSITITMATELSPGRFSSQFATVLY